jgi:hypothetical protein
MLAAKSPFVFSVNFLLRLHNHTGSVTRKISWFPRSCVVTLYVMHSHAGAWERGNEKDKKESLISVRAARDWVFVLNIEGQ